LSKPRDLSKILTSSTSLTTDVELVATVNSASAYALSQANDYTDTELSGIDLTSAIQTASAAAVSYADGLTTADVAENTNLYFTNQRAVNAGSATYILQTNQQAIINSASAAAVTAVINGAPGALDTLDELAAALGDDQNFAATVTNSLAAKLDASSASTTYLTQSGASSTYLTQATGLTATSASTTYLTQANASTVYAPKASPTFTGTVNFTSASVIGIDALPSQSSNSGKYLTTDGTTASWELVDTLPTQTGNSGKYLTTNGASASWATLSIDPFVVSASSNYTVLNEYTDQIIYTNTSSGSLTLTLPSSPVGNTSLKIIDASNSASDFPIAINGNGKFISNSSATYTVNVAKSSLNLIYNSTNNNWVLDSLYFPLARPGTPTSVSATDVGTARAYNDGAATVSFVSPTTGGLVDSYTVTSTPGNYTGSGASSPITVSGLQSDTAYTFIVRAINAAGTGISAASSSITATTVPQAPTISTVDFGFELLKTNYSAGSTGGKSVTAYTATRTGAVSVSGSSPITFTGLTGGTAYTISMIATNANGNSIASNSVVQTPWSATGGTISTSGSYRIHRFNSSSNFTVTGQTLPSVEYLIVGGGGAGGSWYGDGGSGNTFLTGTTTAAPGVNPVVVGGGGAGGGNGTYGVGGTSSSALSFTDTGAGGGGGGQAGGSGAGGGGQGQTGGNGGPGLTSSITGTSTFYAAGGAGSDYYGNGGRTGGSGIGGNGGYRQSVAGTNAVANSGAGGGGGSELSSGSGGAGIVVLRYLTT
jgi:hypothetical protein